MAQLDIQKLKTQFNLTLNEDETKIYVLPHNKWEFTSCPLDDLSKCILITPEEFIGFMANVFIFNDDLTACEDYRDMTEEEFKQLQEQHEAQGSDEIK